MTGKIICKIVVVFLCYVGTTIQLGAQSKLTLTLSSDSLPINNYVVLKYTMEGTDFEFQKPDFTDWNVVSGPNTSQQMSIMNGKVSKSMSLQYTLLMSEVGEFLLPSSSVTYEGKPIEVPTVKVIVQPSGGPKEEGKISKLREKVVTLNITEGTVDKSDKPKVVRQLKKI